MAGKNLRQKNDPLQAVELRQFFTAIRKPKPHIHELIKQLRVVQTIDINRYRQLKTKLPYVCCGNFHPPYRRLENFGSIQHFILDLDHLLEKDINILTLKEKIKADDRVELAFNSPGNNGLKVFFRLKEKCYDAAKYSLFYKLFVQKFSEQYQLQQVIDKSTSDVTRACFISCDSNAYFNPEPIVIDMASFINFNNAIEVRKAQKSILQKETDALAQNKTVSVKRGLTDELLQEVKQKLKPTRRKKDLRKIHIPKELEKIPELVSNKVAEFDIQIKEVVNIHYGKKLVFTYSPIHWAEINVFYGKKGFTVVRSPKRGQDVHLEEVVYHIMCDLFYNTSDTGGIPNASKNR